MQLSNHSNPLNQVQQNQIAEFEKALIIHCQIEGKQAGLINKPVNESEFRALIMNYAESQTQPQIDNNHQTHTPISGMVIAKQIQSEAKEKINPLRASLTDNEHIKRPLESQKKDCCPDLTKRLLRRCVYVGAGIISIAEGYFAYEAFRSAPIPKIASLFAAAGIAVAIGFGSHFLASYIRKAKTRWQRLFRYSIVLIPAFIGFYFMGNLRSSAYNQIADLQNQINQSSISLTGSVSPFSITILSFLLFLTALLFSIHVCKTEEEREQDKRYDKACREIKEIENKTKLAEQKIDAIQKDAIEKSQEALARFEFATATENRLQAIAKHAIEEFKTANLRYRTDGLCPTFFTYPPAFNFRLFFNNVKTSQHEKGNFSYVN
jgi:hypothetical protein